MVWVEIDENTFRPEKGYTHSVEWLLQRAYKTSDECADEKQRQWAKQVDVWEKLKESSPSLVGEIVDKVPGEFVSLRFHSKGGEITTWRYTYRCLPDTIDPREKNAP